MLIMNTFTTNNNQRRGSLNVMFDDQEVEICTIKFAPIDLSGYYVDDCTNNPTTPVENNDTLVSEKINS